MTLSTLLAHVFLVAKGWPRVPSPGEAVWEGKGALESTKRLTSEAAASCTCLEL